MIQYDRSAFAVGLLLRIHGSAVYRATIPGLFGVAVFVLLRELWTRTAIQQPDQLLHPYAVGVLVASTTFLLVFRVQQAYARYWEGASATHHMMSKWMDATSHTACYHMQCSHYNHIKPPSYYDYHELNDYFLTRDREERSDSTTTTTRRGGGSANEHSKVGIRAVNKSIESVTGRVGSKRYVHKNHSKSNLSSNDESETTESTCQPVCLYGPPRLDGNWGEMFQHKKDTFFNARHPERKDPAGFASHQGGRTPPLFLQELAHLASLLVGVALSTLRNDIEGAESPLGIYEPGSPWPEVDPEKDKKLLYHNQGLASLWQKFLNFLGMGRSAEWRTRYNASRPMPILGGVSEGEIRFLQMARGPYAKTQLCWAWLSEFCIREHLAGSTGNVGPPIISRIIQFLGDGMIFYNHARKIMFIPFPFPHAQLTAVFVLVMIPAVAFLMDQYTDDMWCGCVLTFLTVTALVGLHEVARELENPFRNIPNELPLVTFQAQFNEALLTMFAGYHPDAFWADTAERILRPENSRRPTATFTRNSKTDSFKSTTETVTAKGEVVSTTNGGTTQASSSQPNIQQLASDVASAPLAATEPPSLSKDTPAAAASLSKEEASSRSAVKGNEKPQHHGHVAMEEKLRFLIDKVAQQELELERLRAAVVILDGNEHDEKKDL